MLVNNAIGNSQLNKVIDDRMQEIKCYVPSSEVVTVNTSLYGPCSIVYALTTHL